MNLEIINPIDYPNWDELLLTNDQTTFFHTSDWAKVLCESYRYKPLYFTVIEDGKLSALIPIMEIKKESSVHRPTMPSELNDSLSRFPTHRRASSLTCLP